MRVFWFNRRSLSRQFSHMFRSDLGSMAWFFERTKECFLQHGQKIPSTENDAGSGEDGIKRADLPDTSQAKEFADKAIEAGQSSAGKAGKDHEGGDEFELGAQATHFLERTSMVAVINHADD